MLSLRTKTRKLSTAPLARGGERLSSLLLRPSSSSSGSQRVQQHLSNHHHHRFFVHSFSTYLSSPSYWNKDEKKGDERYRNAALPRISLQQQYHSSLMSHQHHRVHTFSTTADQGKKEEEIYKNYESHLLIPNMISRRKE